MAGSLDLKRVSIGVFGRVQGVGFRYFVRERAESYGLSGWVRNRSDGSVEIEAQGHGSDVERFISEIRRGPSMGYVEDLHIKQIPADEDDTEFRVRF